MKLQQNITGAVAAAAIFAIAAAHAPADHVRNVKSGEPVPPFQLPTIDAKHANSQELLGNVVVVVYLSAEQRSSELAAVESQAVVDSLDTEHPVKLIQVTADVVHKPYYERFRREKRITAPLAFDAGRSLYADLGLIVFPTTVVIDPEGNLAHVISTRGADYDRLLADYVRHALKLIDDDELKERMKSRHSDVGSPKSLASRHRAAARLLREKNLLDPARDELLAARQLDPDNLDIIIDLAEIELALGDLSQTEQLVESVLEVSPQHRRAKLLQGITLFRLDRLDEAETILVETLVLNPDPARTHYYLGRIYERKGDQTKAIRHYREALTRLLNEPGT